MKFNLWESTTSPASSKKEYLTQRATLRWRRWALSLTHKHTCTHTHTHTHCSFTWAYVEKSTTPRHYRALYLLNHSRSSPKASNQKQTFLSPPRLLFVAVLLSLSVPVHFVSPRPTGQLSLERERALVSAVHGDWQEDVHQHHRYPGPGGGQTACACGPLRLQDTPQPGVSRGNGLCTPGGSPAERSPSSGWEAEEQNCELAAMGGGDFSPSIFKIPSFFTDGILLQSVPCKNTIIAFKNLFLMMLLNSVSSLIGLTYFST